MIEDRNLIFEADNLDGSHSQQFMLRTRLEYLRPCFSSDRIESTFSSSRPNNTTSSPREQRLPTCDSSIVEEHTQSPAQNHTKRQNKKQRRGLLDRHDRIEIAVGEDANNRRHHHNHKETRGPLHHDAPILQR